MYEYIEENIESLKKYSQKAFNNSRLRLLSGKSLDNEAVIKEVIKLYKKLKKKSDEFYNGLILFLLSQFQFGEDEYELKVLLSKYDQVLLYSFAGEYERKKSRYMEILLSIGDISDLQILEQQKKAIRIWNQMVEEFAVGIEEYITLCEFKKVGVEEVLWLTMADEKVCEACADLNGRTFSINNVPKRPHIGCRCWIVEV